MNSCLCNYTAFILFLGDKIHNSYDLSRQPAQYPYKNSMPTQEDVCQLVPNLKLAVNMFFPLTYHHKVNF